MRSNSLAMITMLVVSLFLISPALACNYPGPVGSSITVFTHTSDGTPLPDTQLILYVYNGSSTVATESGSTGDNGKFTFPNDGSGKKGLSYKIVATYYGDTVTVDCEGPSHSASYGPFSLSENENKNVDITISGVTVAHGGNSGKPTSTPKPSPTAKPIVPKGNHTSYPPMADGDAAGTVAGVVLSSDTSEPTAGAYVAIVRINDKIVECTDSNVEYSCMYTDSNGFFQFNGVNSTRDAIYQLYVTDGYNVAYSDPFKVGSGESVKINMQLGQKNGELPVISPTPTAPGNATITPSPSAKAPAVNANVAAPNNPNIIDQIVGFIGSLIAGIIPS